MRAHTVALFILLVGLLALAVSCGDGDSTDRSPVESPGESPVESPGDSAAEEGLPLMGIGSDRVPPEGFGVRSELVTEAEFPVTLAFAPDGRLFYNERLTGNIRVVTADGELLPEPFAQVEVDAIGEWGLLGLAIDPDFSSNHYVYIYFTPLVPEKEKTAKPTVMRFTDVDNRGVDPTVIIGDLPEVRDFHVGGNIHFGPDGFLYVTIGDNMLGEGEVSQDLSALPGKILRVNKADGSAPPDNPFVSHPGADPRIYAYGFRNAFDFAFHPETGQMYATENGDANCDELNFVVGGGNYGWPLSKATGLCQNPRAIEAIYYFTRHDSRKPGNFRSTVAPTGLEFVQSGDYPLLEKSLLVCEWNTGYMRHYFLDGEDRSVVSEGSIVVRDCRLDIALDGDGIAYYSNETEIRRLEPTE